MPEKTNKAIIITLLIGIVILVIININLNSRFTNLEMSINNHQHHQMREMQLLYGELLHRIDSINEQIVQNTKLSFDESVLIKGYNQADSSLDVEISFYLREYNLEDNMNVTAIGLNGQTFSSEARLSPSGRFTAAMTLPIEDNYTLSFTARRGSSVKSGEMTALFLADKLCERFSYALIINQHSNTVMLSPRFINDTPGNQSLTIKDISLIAESDGTVVGFWDLLPYLQSRGNRQAMGVDDTLGHIELPIARYSQREGENARNRDLGYVISGEFFVARLVMYDHLGIRYEQVDQIYVSDIPNRGGGGGSGRSIDPNNPSKRFIEYGEYAWGHIHIVRQ